MLLLLGSAGGAATTAFVVVVTGQQVADAFVIALAIGVAGALVASGVSFVKWLARIDRKFDDLRGQLDDQRDVVDSKMRAIEQQVVDTVAAAERRWTEANLRLANLERAVAQGDGETIADALTRIEHRGALVARKIGADGSELNG